MSPQKDNVVETEKPLAKMQALLRKYKYGTETYWAVDACIAFHIEYGPREGDPNPLLRPKEDQEVDQDAA